MRRLREISTKEMQISVYRSGAAAPLGPRFQEGKRSAVAVVNDSPVGCQSRDRAARRRLAFWASIRTK